LYRKKNRKSEQKRKSDANLIHKYAILDLTCFCNGRKRKEAKDEAKRRPPKRNAVTGTDGKKVKMEPPSEEKVEEIVMKNLCLTLPDGLPVAVICALIEDAGGVQVEKKLWPGLKKKLAASISVDDKAMISFVSAEIQVAASEKYFTDSSEAQIVKKDLVITALAVADPWQDTTYRCRMAEAGSSEERMWIWFLTWAPRLYVACGMQTEVVTMIQDYIIIEEMCAMGLVDECLQHHSLIREKFQKGIDWGSSLEQWSSFLATNQMELKEHPERLFQIVYNLPDGMAPNIAAAKVLDQVTQRRNIRNGKKTEPRKWLRQWGKSQLRSTSISIGKLQDSVCGAIFTDDGDTIISASRENVQIWDSSDVKNITLKETFQAAFTEVPSKSSRRRGSIKPVYLTTIALSRDNQWLATGDSAGFVKGWDLKTKTLMGSCHGVYPDPIIEPQDPQDAAAGKKPPPPIPQEPRAHFGKVNTVCFNYADNLIASGGEDKVCRIWDTVLRLMEPAKEEVTEEVQNIDNTGAKVFDKDEDGNQLETFPTHRVVVEEYVPEVTTQFVMFANLYGHLGTVLGSAFSPDDRCLITTSEDTYTRKWNVEVCMNDLKVQHAREATRVASNHVDDCIKSIEAGEIAIETGEDAHAKFEVKLSAFQKILAKADGGGDMKKLAELQKDVKTAFINVKELKVELQVLRDGFDDSVKNKAKIDEALKQIISEVNQTRKDAGEIRFIEEPIPVEIRLPKVEEDDPEDTDERGEVKKKKKKMTVHDNDDTWNQPHDNLDIITPSELMHSHQMQILLFGECDGDPFGIPSDHQKPVFCCAFNPDGSYLATGSSDSFVKIFDTTTWTIVSTLEGHSFAVTGLQFTRDGLKLVSTSWDKKTIFWEADIMVEEKQLLGHTEAILSVCYHPSEKYIVTASADSTIQVWDISLDPVVPPPEGTAQRAEYDEYRETFIARNARLRRRKDRFVMVEKEREAKGIKDPHAGAVLCVAFNNYGLLMASGAEDAKIKIWDVMSCEALYNLIGHEAPVTAVVWNATSTTLYSSSLDSTVIIWDVTNHIRLGTLISHTAPVNGIDLHPDGEMLVSGSDDGTVQLWDLQMTLQEANSLPTLLAKNSKFELHHDKDLPVNAVCFPKAKNVVNVASASDDCTIRLWDIRDGEEKMCFKGHFEMVDSISFDHRGEILASGMRDKTIKLWEVSTGWCKANLPVHHKKRINNIAFSVDGVTMISVSDDRSIKLWDNTAETVKGEIHGSFGMCKFVCYSPNGALLAICHGSSICTLMETIDKSVPNANSFVRPD